MRHLRYSNTRGSTLIDSHRRVSLNAIVLPPLSPAITARESKLLEATILQVNKTKSNGVNPDLMAITRSPDVPSRTPDVQKSPEATRVTQLEQNIKFLQEQHQHMLSDLHKEIDVLRHKNRDLQFQLVFVKASLPSTPSSPEDDTKPKVNISPSQVNVVPLQVEILERELRDMKIQLQEVENREVYLSTIVDEQRKKLELQEHEAKRESDRNHQAELDLSRKLEDAEVLIRRLQRENEDLKRDGGARTSPRSPTNYPHRDSSSYNRESTSQNGQKGPNQHRGNGRHRGGGGGHYRNWFPPVHSQNYWQNGRTTDKNNGLSLGEASTLPSLQSGDGGTSGQYQSRKGVHNNNYQHEGRKYKGGQNRGHHKPS